MSAVHSAVLGKGIYTPADIARYGRIPSVRKVARWARGIKGHAPVIQRELPDDPDRVLTFLDFAQLQAIRAIMLHDPSISLRKIREAIDWHEKRHHVEYPLAREHKIIHHDDTLYIHLSGVDDPSDPNLYRQTTGDGKEQTMIREIAEFYQRNMHYHDSGLASKFTLFSEGKRRIIMDPQVCFGEPFIESCGYTLDSVLNAYQAEGSPKGAAEAFGIKEADVRLALACDNYLGLPPAP